MSYRIASQSSDATLISQIADARGRISLAQERIGTGKRINRPSDDPHGAGAVVRIRNSQAELAQFQHATSAAKTALTTGDNALESYQQVLDQARVALQQGASTTSTPEERGHLAAELDSLRTQILSLANTSADDRYVFGGTRQNAAPYDINEVPAATAAATQAVQIDPAGATAALGVTAETVFADGGGTIFAALRQASAALRGTGNPTADQAALTAGLDRLKGFADVAATARTQVGVNLARVQNVEDHLQQSHLAYEESAQRIESADLAQSAIELNSGEQTLNAILQAGNPSRRRSLIDLLG